jgi:GNAT superfamily N-acetyltransferase
MSNRHLDGRAERGQWSASGPMAIPSGLDPSGVRIAPLEPGHSPAVRRHLERLSLRSRYLRFGSAQPEVRDDLVARLSDLDGHDRAAWGAFDGVELVGIAFLVRLADDRRSGEFALSVVDAAQGRGIGRRLLAHLAAAAPLLGMDRLSFYVLGENRRMLRLLDAAGAEYRIRAGAADGVVDARRAWAALTARRAA